MKFLLDTNEFIAAEPAQRDDLEPGSPWVAELIRNLFEGGHDVYVHPAARLDIERDADDDRRAVRAHHFDKYPKLPAPPPTPDRWYEEFGRPEPRGNDDVDLRHLAAVDALAVHYLVTEDRRLQRRAQRVGLGERVVTVEDALGLLRNLYGTEPAARPAAEKILAHQISVDDSILDSLRDDYPGFDAWFERARLEHREGWVVRAPGGEGLAAICLIKSEGAENDARLPGQRILKISTFKVSPDHTGHRYGELLLKAVFTHAAAVGHDGIYLTVYDDRHPGLVALLEDFGFETRGFKTERDEAILAKRRPTAQGMVDTDEQASSLEHHVRYGPPAVRVEDDKTFVVPIKPTYVHRLFPEAYPQMQLLDPAPCGNAIRKAYLCRAATREIEPGATLLFYRSVDEQEVFAVGVVDDVVVSRVPEEIASEVGTRTVYGMHEIEHMTRGGEVLAILFRQDRVLDARIGRDELVKRGVLKAHPQSITKIKLGTAPWIGQRIGA